MAMVEIYRLIGFLYWPTRADLKTSLIALVQYCSSTLREKKKMKNNHMLVSLG